MTIRKIACINRGISLVLFTGLSISCGSPSSLNTEGTSQPLVTDVAHTVAKRQSIGNCWLYAAATWLESLELSYTKQNLNVSESYWTWWHFYNQIVGSRSLTSLETGGSWSVARDIILRHGFVREEDFIPSESKKEISLRQKQAQQTIDRELSEGALQDPSKRTPELVRKVLDQAFGTDMAAAEAIAERADRTELVTDEAGNPVTLRQLLDRRSEFAWKELAFPRVFGESSVVDRGTELQRRSLWSRVFRALNDKQPVVVSLKIDFNGLDERDGTFRGNLLKEEGVGSQGGHLVVVEDYTVTNVPGIGRIGRGDVSPELKEKALQGQLETLVVKNSWGVNRPDRGIRDGITAFDRSYLEGQFPWKLDDEAPEKGVAWYTTLSSFILPPGY